MGERYVAWTRQVTGDPLRYYAYAFDTQTRRHALTCKHNHRRRAGKSGLVFATACAERMARKLNRAEPEATKGKP